MSDACGASRSHDYEHPRGDRFAAPLEIDPDDHVTNPALIELLDGATWAGQVRATSSSTDVLAEFDFTVDTIDGVLTVVGVIVDTDDFLTSNVFDYQATLVGGGTVTFLAGSTITVIGDTTRITGS